MPGKCKSKQNYRKQLPEGMNYRTLSVRLSTEGKPSSLDEGTRSVEVIGATENPVKVFDYERWENINEILLMSGCQLPDNGQIPLLDSHWRFNTFGVIGSYRDMSLTSDHMLGRAHYSEVEEAQGPYQKTREGHLTDYSVGYRVEEAHWIPEGEKQVIDGRTFEGPVKVVTKWIPKEMSVCPIGADEMAKARSAGAGSSNTKTTNRKERKMDEKIREFLESRGLAKTATDDEARTFLLAMEVPKGEGLAGEGARTAGAPLVVGESVDVQAAVIEAVRAEQGRVFEIRSMFDKAGCSDQIDAYISGNKTTDEARAFAFKHVTENGPTAGGSGYRAPMVIGADARDNFRAAAQDSILLRSGISIEKPAAGASELQGFSLREMARECLRVAGQPTGGNPMEMVGRALTTSDLPILLANTANKSLFAGFETEEETYSMFCDDTGSVSDFKINTSARASETDDLDEIGEDGEYEYGSMDEGKEEYQIATYGKLFKLSRQTIINDDLMALTDIPRKHGEAAARKIGDIAYAVLTANSAMGDGTALFHGDHGNLGTAGAISETTTAEAIKLMKLQKDLKGLRNLNISARYFIAPASIEGAAEIFFNSGQFAGTGVDATRTNPYAGTRFIRVYDARLDEDSATAYYFAGAKGKAVKLFFLNGNKTPYLETKQGWTVDGVEYKVRIDATAKAMDWKALVKNAGA